MSTDEYVPSDQNMAHWFEGEEDPEHGRALWDRWLAAHDDRVRRDAAREALDGLADQFNNWAEPAAEESARVYRDTHYPEETP